MKRARTIGVSVVLLTFVSIVSSVFAADPALPNIPDKTFSVTDYGTKGDGKNIDTQAIGAALDAAEKAGGGVVKFPAGTYLTGAIHLRSNVELHLDKDATILFSTDPADYPVILTRWEGTECMNFCGLLTGQDLHDIAITGEGTIEGQGANWWAWARKAGASARHLRELGETTDDPKQRVFGTADAALRPCMFEPINCQRVLLEGVKFDNSPMWTIHPIYCSDITAKNLDVHGTGPNTDGFDPDSCSNLLIENCTFNTGDDCICLKSGRDKDGRRVGKATENVTVRHCTFGKGHGTVVIGSEMSGGVRNVFAEDLTADGTDAGVRIKTRRGRGGTVENITYRNMNLKNIAKQAISIDMFYDAGNNPGVDQSSAEGLPVFKNITIENFNCDGANAAIVLRGLPDSPIQGVTMNNVDITAKQGSTITGVQDVKSGNVSVKIAAPSSSPVN
jgi:polygalacturonase